MVPKGCGRGTEGGGGLRGLKTNGVVHGMSSWKKKKKESEK